MKTIIQGFIFIAITNLTKIMSTVWLNEYFCGIWI
jgi:hypothetical protein